MLFPWNKKQLTGTREEILNKLKELANPNCNKCYGRGHLGFKEGKTKAKDKKILKPNFKPKVQRLTEIQPHWT